MDAITSPIVTPAITEQNSTPLLTLPGENETGGQVNEQPDHEQERGDKYYEETPKCSPLEASWEEPKSPTVETPISPTGLSKWKAIQEQEAENDNNTNTIRNTTTEGQILKWLSILSLFPPMQRQQAMVIHFHLAKVTILTLIN